MSYANYDDILPDLITKLGEGKLVSAAKQEWEFPCPKCKHPTHLHVSLLSGLFVCVTPGCLYKGIVNTLIGRVRRGPIVIPKPPEVNHKLLSDIYTELVFSSKLSDFHKAYLNNRGICPTIIPFRSTDYSYSIVDKFSIQDLQYAGLLDKDGKFTRVLGTNRIIIPFVDRCSGNIVYIRSRTAGNDKIKYYSPSGVPGNEFIFGWNLLDLSKKYVIVTEGEFKALSASQIGFNCIGLCGISSGHEFVAKKCAQLGIRVVYIVFDTEVDVINDVPKQVVIDAAAEKLSRKLNSLGIITYIARLPSSTSKVDLDSYINANINEAAEKLSAVLYLSEVV